MGKLRKSHAKVTCESYESCKSYESYESCKSYRGKLREDKKVPFLWNCAGAGVRQKKKLQKGLAS